MIDQSAWFTGTDPSEAVLVSIDGPAGHARVAVRPGWRERVGPALAGAVLMALADAISARLRAWAAGPIRPDAVPVWAPPRDDTDLLLAAVRELAEFELQIRELQAATRTVTSAGGRVRASVRAGQVAELFVDGGWSARVRDAELEGSLGEALTGALRLIADTPQEALGHCPALATVLAHAGAGVG